MQHIEVGSANRIIQFSHTYIELLGEIAQAQATLRDNLTRRLVCGEGLCMVSLTSNAIGADYERVVRKGLSPEPLVNARRCVRMPDGSMDETDSRCFYFWRPGRPFLSLFFTEHRKPETIWISQYQAHPNTAVDVTAVVFVSDDPARDLDYFAALYDCKPETDEPGLVRFRGASKDLVEIYSRDRLPERFRSLASDADCNELSGYPVGMQIVVREPARLLAILRQNRIPHLVEESSVRVGPKDAVGVIIEFISK